MKNFMSALTSLALPLAFLCTAASAQQRPEIVLQRGHARDIGMLAFSPDGRSLASLGFEGIKLWDVATGRELRTFDDTGVSDSRPQGGIGGLAFSPDGTKLAGGGGRKSVKLWDVVTGRELRTFDALDTITAVAFSPDGKVLAGVTDGAAGSPNVLLWDAETAKSLLSIPGHKQRVSSVAFSPDGRVLATGSREIRLWDARSGKELRTLKGHEDDVNGTFVVAFSPDGKTLASGGSDNALKLWEVATGREIFSHTHPYWVTSIAFSRDGRMLASTFTYNRCEVFLWDASTGGRLKPDEGADEISGCGSVAFSPANNTLASALGGEVQLWSADTRKELRKIEPVDKVTTVSAVAFSPEDKFLATISKENENYLDEERRIKLWDLKSGAGVRKFTLPSQGLKAGDGKHNFFTSIVFSPDGKTLASGSETEGGATQDGQKLRKSTVKLWDVATGKEVREIGHLDRPILSIVYSPDGKSLAVSTWDADGGTATGIKLFDAETGKLLRLLAKNERRNFEQLIFSSDGKVLVSVTAIAHEVQRWDVATGVEVKGGNLTETSQCLPPVAFSPDGKILGCRFMGLDEQGLKLYEVGTGRLLRAIAGAGSVAALSFSPEGKLIAGGHRDGTVKLWESDTGKTVWTQAGHTGAVNSLAFKSDGKILASGGEDTSVKLWEARGGAELATLLALGPERLVPGADYYESDERDWLVVTPDGLFDGTQAAWGKILWRFSKDTFKVAPVEIYFKEFFHPGLLSEILSGKRPAPRQSVADHDRRQPRLELTLAGETEGEKSGEPKEDLVPTTYEREVELRVRVLEAPAGAQDVRLFRNGSLVRVWRGDVLTGRPPATLEATVRVVAGDNHFTAYAFNRENVKSADAHLNVLGAEELRRKGTARILTVGVNEYANPQYNLRYAVADARSFGEQVRRSQEALGVYDEVEVTSFTDGGATKGAIMRALTELSDRTEPEDSVIIYFAGHGTAHGNRFYLIPHDLGYAGSRDRLNETGLREMLSHSISDEELERTVEDLDAGQLLLVIDACNSGQALEAEERRRGPMNSKGLAQLAYEKGMYILTAAQSYQAALETAQLGHGLLTFALVEEGLKGGRADGEPKDGQVLMREWLDFAAERVPQMQIERMREAGRRGLKVAYVAGDENIADPEKRSVQRPRVFYRRGVNSQPLAITKP